MVVPTIAGRERLLERALRSVETQTYRAARVLVQVDERREGAAVTRNRALAKVDTDWVAFLDDDDELYPNHLRALARFARFNQLDVAYPGYDCTGDDTVNCFGCDFDPELLKRANFIPVTVLASTAAVREAGGFQPHPDRNGDPCEDWGLWLAMLANGARFAHLPQKTWRWHNDRETTRGKGHTHSG